VTWEGPAGRPTLCVGIAVLLAAVVQLRETPPGPLDVLADGLDDDPPAPQLLRHSARCIAAPEWIKNEITLLG